MIDLTIITIKTNAKLNKVRENKKEITIDNIIIGVKSKDLIKIPPKAINDGRGKANGINNDMKNANENIDTNFIFARYNKMLSFNMFI